MNPPFKLVNFQSTLSSEIAGWATSLQEAHLWCGHKDTSMPRSSIFETWHVDPDIHPHVLLQDHQPIAYGETWVDREEDEIELARLIVKPSERGRGVGRQLVLELVQSCSPFGIAQIYMRVVPENVPAISCYLHAGFTRVPESEEYQFNENQPIKYVWLQLKLSLNSETT